jgi:hypothetical protein
MVILFKIVKIGQLQMGVESREPIMHSVFFRLKHSITIVEQKKTSYGELLPDAILSKKSKVIMATWSQDMLEPEESKP